MHFLGTAEHSSGSYVAYLRNMSFVISVEIKYLLSGTFRIHSGFADGLSLLGSYAMLIDKYLPASWRIVLYSSTRPVTKRIPWTGRHKNPSKCRNYSAGDKELTSQKNRVLNNTFVRTLITNSNSTVYTNISPYFTVTELPSRWYQQEVSTNIYVITYRKSIQ